MGKSKKRNIAQARNQKELINITRSEAIKQITTALKNNEGDEEVKKLITLFGIRAEELTEEDISYEAIKCLVGII